MRTSRPRCVLARSPCFRYNWMGTLSRLPPRTKDNPMLAKVRSGALIGLEAPMVDIVVGVTMGRERMTVVGLPDGAVR